MNIFLDAENNAKLGDFGLATATDFTTSKFDDMSMNANNDNKKQCAKKIQRSYSRLSGI